MNNTHNPKLTSNARNLRNNMTPQERHLWYDFLKTLPVNCYRQKVIGNYIVDFYCAQKKLVIELDGSQHFSEKGLFADKTRDDYLNGIGITILRYSNSEINTNFKGVCQDILAHLGLEC